MTLSIASSVIKSAKLLGENKNLRVLLNEFTNGKKVIESFDKSTGALVKRVTKGPELDRILETSNAKIPFRCTQVKKFYDGICEDMVTIYHPKSNLPDNTKGQLACHRKIKEFWDCPWDDGNGLWRLGSTTDIYTFDLKKNPKGLRAIVDKRYDGFCKEDTLTLCGKDKWLGGYKTIYKNFEPGRRYERLGDELSSKFFDEIDMMMDLYM